MDKAKILTSLEFLSDIVSNRTPGFKRKLLENVGAKIQQERIAFFCAVFYSFCATLVLLLFVFFGYKLYKSLVERERRREEKKRQKLQKKKK